MADIFVSYSRPDRERVRPLVDALQAQGLTVFWDSAIQAGQRWDTLINTELDGARCIVVVWSQNAVLSNWVKDEATTGKDREILMPVSIDGVRAPLGFRMIQTADLSGWSNSPDNALLTPFLAGVRRILGTQPAPPESIATPKPLDARYDYSTGAHADGSFVVDYVSECGDSFASTYAMAWLIANHDADAKAKADTPARPGNMLIVGINDPHPRPPFETYENTLVRPFAMALRKSAQHRPLFAAPGYHRSKEGMAHFESFFCSAAATNPALGGWDTQQREPFFAVALPHRWWIWSVDIRTGEPLAVKQFNYFSQIAERLTADDKIVLVSAQENWLLPDFDGWIEQDSLSKIVVLAEAAHARIVAVVNGGWFEYSHNTTAQGRLHLIGVGGGRRVVYPTHGMPNRIVVRWPSQRSARGDADALIDEAQAESLRQVPVPNRWARQDYDNWQASWFQSKFGSRSVKDYARQAVADVINWAATPRSATLDDAVVQASRPSGGRVLTKDGFFPEPSESARLGFKNLTLPFSNLSFALGIGFVYLTITWQFFTVVEQFDISSGRIDAIANLEQWWSILKFMPLYLAQAMLVSLVFLGMLLGFFIFCCWFASTYQKPGFRRLFTKLGIGGAHAMTHIVAMFALATIFVLVNTAVARPVQQYLGEISQNYQRIPAAVRPYVEQSLEGIVDAPRQRPPDAAKAEGAPQSPPQSTALPGTDVAPPRPTNNRVIRQTIGIILYPLEMTILGGLVGGFIWGVYLSLTNLLGGGFAVTAFSQLRLKGYRCFLRLHITPDKLTIHPLGLKRIPPRRFWRDGAPDSRSALVPRRPLQPEPIEPPIVIDVPNGDRGQTPRV